MEIGWGGWMGKQSKNSNTIFPNGRIVYLLLQAMKPSSLLRVIATAKTEMVAFFFGWMVAEAEGN